MLGGLETLQELCEAMGYSGYGRLFGYFISSAAPLKLAGAPFIAAAALMLGALALIRATLSAYPEAAAAAL